MFSVLTPQNENRSQPDANRSSKLNQINIKNLFMKPCLFGKEKPFSNVYCGRTPQTTI